MEAGNHTRSWFGDPVEAVRIEESVAILTLVEELVDVNTKL